MPVRIKKEVSLEEQAAKNAQQTLDLCNEVVKYIMTPSVERESFDHKHLMDRAIRLRTELNRNHIYTSRKK